MKLYSFFRSGTSHRLRIALNLKGLAYDVEAVDLRREQHLKSAYKAVHPQGLAPALQTDGDDGLLIHSHRPSSNGWKSAIPSRRCCRPSRWAAPKCARWQPSSAATSTRSTTAASWKRCATTSVRTTVPSIAGARPG